MEIKPLNNISFDQLFAAFEQAFADYELQLDKSELFTLLKRRGFNPKLSFAAFDGDKIVSFTCNGIGDFYGIRTAYDSGTGTLKAYRGKGLATRVFEHSIPYLKEAGIKDYLLEVLQHNTSAVSVYRKLGFEVIREFYYFRMEQEKIKHTVKAVEFPYTIEPVAINAYDSMSGFWDFRPSWQNSFESINRALEDFSCLGAFTEGKLVGYGVFEPASGDVTQIAVDKQYRCQGVGSLLFQKMLDLNKYGSIKVVNTDRDCESIIAFLKAKNMEPTGKQFEMIKKL